MRIVKIAAMAAATCAAASAASADPHSSVQSADEVCAIFDATGMLSAECSVSGFHLSVDVSADMSAPEAIKLCSMITDIVYEKGIRFDDGWKIRIYSPFSGSNTIATCKFE